MAKITLGSRSQTTKCRLGPAEACGPGIPDPGTARQLRPGQLNFITDILLGHRNIKSGRQRLPSRFYQTAIVNLAGRRGEDATRVAWYQRLADRCCCRGQPLCFPIQTWQRDLDTTAMGRHGTRGPHAVFRTSVKAPKLSSLFRVFPPFSETSINPALMGGRSHDTPTELLAKHLLHDIARV